MSTPARPEDRPPARPAEPATPCPVASDPTDEFPLPPGTEPTELARTFPSTRNASGVDPWDAEVLEAWAQGPLSHGERVTARFGRRQDSTGGATTVPWDSLAGLPVLVVDDNATTRRILRRWLLQLQRFPHARRNRQQIRRRRK